MALIGSKSSFVVEKVSRTSKCGECRKTIRVGSDSLVSKRYGKVQKRVYSEECRLTFDDRYWQGQANERAMGRCARSADRRKEEIEQWMKKDL